MKTRPIVRLTENGIDWGTAPEADDEIGYAMGDEDDCLAAAIATVTQVPIEQVPDLALDERLRRGEDPAEINRTSWERIDRWAGKRGLQGMYWSESELPVPRRRWIGVCCNDPAEDTAELSGVLNEVPRRTHFNDHCLVMSYDRLIFDPSCSIKVPPGTMLMTYRPEHINYGLSFEPKEE